jgi:hypothetical protein
VGDQRQSRAQESGAEEEFEIAELFSVVRCAVQAFDQLLDFGVLGERDVGLEFFFTSEASSARV